MANENNNQQYRHLALAGVCQAAALVKQIARTGDLNQSAFATSIKSITVTEPQNSLEVFGSFENMQLGLSTLINQLGNNDKVKDVEITRYVANLLGLERKISTNKKTLSALSQRVSNIQRQQLHLELLDEQMISNIAAIYSDVISPIGRKIQIAGSPTLLKRADNQHKVRAALLAGLRSAVLWRQLGGKRRQILFSRQSILRDAKAALNQTTATN